MTALTVVCTGRGTHDAWRFGESIAVGIADETGRRLATSEVYGDTDGPVVLRCPRCRRNPRWSRRDWGALCAGWRTDGRDTLDISAVTR